jgi:predicted nucleic acid-binding protein
MKIFLDANVIADWILVKNKVRDDDQIKDDVILERYRQIGYSFRLIDKIIKSNKKIAITSQLVLAEVFSVIYDDVINMKLFAKAIPTALWNWISIRGKEVLSEDEAYEIYNDTMKSFDELFSGVELVEETYNLELLGYFILKLGLKTHDAVILTTALENDATYFVTRDVRLIENLRAKEFKNKFSIKVRKPNAVLRELKF